VLAGVRLESNITVATPKVSLLGGWLNLPRWASHPLEFTVLPGRSKIAGLTEVLVFAEVRLSDYFFELIDTAHGLCPVNHSVAIGAENGQIF
jgi:hypothetical protein